VHPVALIRAVLMAFVTTTPSLESLAERFAWWLRTACKTTLSYALKRDSSLRMVQALLASLGEGQKIQPNELVAIDSMPLTLPATRRHTCRKINSASVGGAILWTFRLRAPRGAHPIGILKIVSGPWHDTQTIADVSLAPRGPIYLMDRGFWAIRLIRQWLEQEVHFVLRVNKQDFTYRTLATHGAPRPAPGGLKILCDGVAELGGPQRKNKPTVRLVVAALADGTDLILVSDQFSANAEEILSAYKQRWQIEQFHRFLKDTLGLAHLYSFHETGIFFLAHVAVLLALLLFLGATARRATTIETMHEAFEALRRSIGEGTRWKRNMTNRPRYNKKKRKRKRTKNH
jgi:Transposase DDE domain